MFEKEFEDRPWLKDVVNLALAGLVCTGFLLCFVLLQILGAVLVDRGGDVDIMFLGWIMIFWGLLLVVAGSLGALATLIFTPAAIIYVGLAKPMIRERRERSPGPVKAEGVARHHYNDPDTP